MANETPNMLPQNNVLTIWQSYQKPGVQDILTLKKEVHESLQAFHTTRGGGAHGHVALMMMNAVYPPVSNGNAFAVPEHPGDAPVHTPNSQPHTIHETNCQYKADLCDFNLYLYIHVTVKAQILHHQSMQFCKIGVCG